MWRLARLLVRKILTPAACRWSCEADPKSYGGNHAGDRNDRNGFTGPNTKMLSMLAWFIFVYFGLRDSDRLSKFSAENVLAAKDFSKKILSNFLFHFEALQFAPQWKWLRRSGVWHYRFSTESLTGWRRCDPNDLLGWRRGAPRDQSLLIGFLDLEFDETKKTEKYLKYKKNPFEKFTFIREEGVLLFETKDLLGALEISVFCRAL